LARFSLEERLPRRVLTDPWVKRCAKFLRAGRIEEGLSRTRRIACSDAILKDAARVRFAPDPLIAAELEARVLCNSPPELIAERCGLTADTVRAFEAVFFDVRHLLAATGYIFHQVIERPIIDGFSLDDLASIWKLCAYMRGPHALDILLFVFPGGKPRPWPSAFPATPAQQRALIATCKLMVLTRCVRIADLEPDEMARFLFLSKWFQQVDEADSVMCSGIGAILEVGLASLLEPRTEGQGSITPRSWSLPVDIPCDWRTGIGGKGTPDRTDCPATGYADLHPSGQLHEPTRRVIA
jgi:hypothetical protein